MTHKEAFRQAAIEHGHTPEEVDRRIAVMETLMPRQDKEIPQGEEQGTIDRLKDMFAVAEKLYKADPRTFDKVIDHQLQAINVKN